MPHAEPRPTNKSLAVHGTPTTHRSFQIPKSPPPPPPGRSLSYGTCAQEAASTEAEQSENWPVSGLTPPPTAHHTHRACQAAARRGTRLPQCRPPEYIPQDPEYIPEAPEYIPQACACCAMPWRGRGLQPSSWAFGDHRLRCCPGDGGGGGGGAGSGTGLDRGGGRGRKTPQDHCPRTGARQHLLTSVVMLMSKCAVLNRLPPWPQ